MLKIETWPLEKIIPSANSLRKNNHAVDKMVEAITTFGFRVPLMVRSSGELVDAFGGSGSTLIACEIRKRKARLMELDPRFCDVIVRRWQEYTGGIAILAGMDACFAQVKDLRGVVDA